MEKEQNTLRALAERDRRYSAGAYGLIGRAVAFASARLTQHRHLTAGEVVQSLMDCAKEEYGFLAEDVLNFHGIYSPADVGELVYLMIEAKLLSASDDDSPEDFQKVTVWFSPENVTNKETSYNLPKIDKEK